jgi:hypothetical protein
MTRNQKVEEVRSVVHLAGAAAATWWFDVLGGWWLILAVFTALWGWVSLERLLDSFKDPEPKSGE